MRPYTSHLIKSLLTVVAVTCVGVSTAGAKPAPEAEVVVIAVHGKAGMPFDGSVSKLVEKPLKRHASIVPAAAYMKAAKRLHVKGPAMFSAKNIKMIGKAAGATHVLLVEAADVKKKRTTINATLYDVGTGHTIFSDQYATEGGRISAEVAAQLLSPVVEKLVPSDSAESELAKADAPVAEEPAPRAHAKEDNGATAANSKEGKPGFLWPPRAEETASEDHGDNHGDDNGDTSTVGASVRPRADRSLRSRPALRIAAGGTFLQRIGQLSVADSGIRTPCYCGTESNANPFFPAFHLSAEYFPMASKGKGRWYENIGVQGDMFFTQVKSFVDIDPSKTITSKLFDFRLGAAYRYVWWNSTTAPDLQVSAGYSYFSFPLETGGFPGVAYGAPYVGATIHAPLGIEEVAAIAGGSYMPSLKGSDDTTKLGTQTSGSGYQLEGGLRFAVSESFEITAMARYQAYSLGYTGQSSLTNSNVSLKDVGLKDRLLEGIVTGGMVF